MTSPRPSTLFPEFADIDGLDEAYAARYPHANIALAVSRLRASRGLTQAEFASRVGTTQSAIARLESGRHGIQTALLDRIANAFGTRWEPVFGADAAETAPGEAARPAMASGDGLLDAFNDANTSNDFTAAQRICRQIAREPLTPRRQVALALDAFNHGRHRKALEFGRAALGGDLPIASRQVSSLVAGRSLLALGRTDEALVVLADAGETEIAGIARCEALMAAGRSEESTALVERLLAAADEGSRAPVAYLAARVYWHADRALEALGHVGAFRAMEPGDRDGRLLNGAILGYIGDAFGDGDAYHRAYALFLESRDPDDPEAERLLAMTSARLGDWRSALGTIAELIARGGRGRAKAERAGHEIALWCFDEIDDAAVLEEAVNAAHDLGLIDQTTMRSRLAEASALRADYDGALKALDRTADDLHQATPVDQLMCAVALEGSGRLPDAYRVLVRVKDALPNPEGYLFLARACLAVRDTTTAREALERVTACDGPAGETARVALELVKGIEQSGRDEALATLELGRDPGTVRFSMPQSRVPAPRSPWEGPALRDGAPEHESASPFLDLFTSASVGFVH
jgi:transcriptional regulator with XRE-family HTH domain